MTPPADAALKLTWLTLLVYWLWSARDMKAVQRSENVSQRLLAYWVPLFTACALLGPGRWYGQSILTQRFIEQRVPLEWLGVAVTFAGVAFACWARHTLGRNWSSVVQIMEGHELIDSGPYQWVRHPIYTGLLLGFVGTAIAIGEWRAPLAALIVFVSFWRKLRLEERWLAEAFGEDYRQYSLRTRALIPGVF